MEILGLWFWQGDLGRLLLQTGWVARGVLLILLLFSVFSWGIIYKKYTTFRQARADTDKFLDAFRAADRLPDARAMASGCPASPLAPVLAAGMKELHSQVGAGVNNPPSKKLTSSGPLSVALQLASSAEIARLEQRMSFLATTASVTPFIGLFGTVWGIIDAFVGLGESGATTLRAVAPGIAEALITTAAGLFAAIPALIAYNNFLHHIRDFATRMDNFALEFVTRAEKFYS